MNAASNSARVGVLYGLVAYGLWGVFPIYFRALNDWQVGPWELLAHRILWSCILLVGVISLTQRWREMYHALRDRRTLLTLTASTLLIASNWLVFLYAVSIGQVLQCSLGYFITPLMNVVLGVAVFRERLRPAQLLGVALAGAAVILMGTTAGAFPWIALFLAITFALYGVCRKKVAVDSVMGLSIETLLVAPLAAVGLALLHQSGGTADHSPLVWLLLALSGVATATPLLLFAGAARRLRFITLGFLQYLAPTIQFLVAVWFFGEELHGKLLSFGLIWAAIGIYCVDSLWVYRRSLDRVPEKPLDVEPPLPPRAVELEDCGAHG